jgi:signal-transduction protein with cAMP-binding, CBS, and nucleotidyltransferase domain
MKRCLHAQIGRNTKAYVDDIVIKSSKARNLIQDLTEAFNKLQKFKIKLNLENVPSGHDPAKC